MNRTTAWSAHPIAEALRQRIEQELSAIEDREQVRILLACESGSRGWGFASADSDYDVRFIYVHSLDWYLRVEPQRDVIELPISDELDISGWELRKVLRLLHKSNPVLLEWLDSPIRYQHDAEFVDALQALAAGFFSPRRGRYHYLSMARKNFRGYLQGESVRLKKYFYVLRPLLAVQWIDRGLGMPPMRFADLVDGLITDAALLEEINALIVDKMQSGEAKYGPRRPHIHAFIQSALAQSERAEPEYVQPEAEEAMLDQLLFQTIMQNESRITQ